MKSKKIFRLLGLALVLAAVALSCQKSRYCLCVSNNSWHVDTIVTYNNSTHDNDTTLREYLYQDTIIVNVDNDMNCKHLMQLGIMKQDSGRLKVDSIYQFDCVKIKKDSLTNYPDLHLQR